MKLIYGLKNATKLNKDEVIYYFGFNFETKKILMDAGYSLFDTRELISTAAHEIRFDFIDYISEIGKKQNNSLKWWSSRIASKSNLQTDFFSLVCLVHVCNKIKYENITVVTDDYRVFFLFKNNFNFKTDFRSAIQVRKESNRIFLKMILSSVPKRFKFVFNRIVYNYKTKKVFNVSAENSTFLYSWVEERSFSSNTGEYNDPYFPDIDKYVGLEKNLVCFCSYYTDSNLVRKLAKNRKVDGLSNYSSLLMLIRSSFYWFNPCSANNFKSYNLRSLWQSEVQSENFKINFVSNIHDYFAWTKFFESNSSKMIYPFENQPWEKVMLLANKNMKMSAVLHTTIHNLLLPFHTTKRELDYMPIPDEIITNSDNTTSLYERYYASSKVTITNAGSLRFKNITSTLNHKKKNTIIGIMLSCISSQTEEMIADITKNANVDFQYLIKLHPDLNTSVQVTDNIQVFKGSAIQLYEKAHAIVYCSSTSGIEAFSKGLPVFRFRTQYMDLETAENSFSPNIVNSVKDISSQSLHFHKALPLFSEANEVAWKDILNNN
jgi:hypothetical protein